MKTGNLDRLYFKTNIKNIDVFWGFNLLLFIWMCQFSYFQRFVEYRGMGNIHEFFVYALLTIIALGFGWRYFRIFSFHTYILVLVQLGILIHFAGGLISVEDARLYDSLFFEIRFDKYVHFINAFIAAVIVNYLMKMFEVRVPHFHNLFICFIVLGLGAIIEIIEYLVMLTIPGNGMGDYHNNMQDLLANAFGCLVFLFFQKIGNIFR